MKVSDGAVVSLNYEVTDDSGIVLDRNRGERSFDYLHGHGNIVPGLEQALEGASEGDRLQVTVAPAEAYGEKDPKAVFRVPRENFPDGMDIQPGMQFTAESERGQARFTVVETAEAEITVDGNHPLAGKTLNFDVEVIGVREATVQELEGSRPVEPPA
jgi:FKBP-type peptidyl-prolyl cis-trans isomerase SlyD